MSLRKLNLTQRQKLIQDHSGARLTHITKARFGIEKIVSANCENIIGTTQVPLGIAGPLKIVSHKKKYYLPLATTEGALVASINRGCKAITLSGGCKTYLENKGTTRGPYLRVKNIAQAKEITAWINQNFLSLQQTSAKSSAHLKLTTFNSQTFGRTLFLRFYFDTSEAMGMNMVTVATSRILEKIQKNFPEVEYVVSGNFCIDKKPASSHLQQGRGKQVWAEVIVPKNVLQTTLKTTAQKVAAVVLNKDYLGSIASSSLGFNAHVANTVAALFIATGQDPAHVVEASHAVVTAEANPDGSLYFSIFIPALLVGTVGGGTNLPTQKEALQILGFDQVHSGDSEQLAQIIAAAALAGELSLTSAIASNDLTKAHQQLGRKPHNHD